LAVVAAELGVFKLDFLVDLVAVAVLLEHLAALVLLVKVLLVELEVLIQTHILAVVAAEHLLLDNQ
jgi:hypothetical protein